MIGRLEGAGDDRRQCGCGRASPKKQVQKTGAIQRVYGESASKLGRFPWWLIRLAQPFVPMFREIMEMRYLWQVPLRLSNARLVALLGNEPHTPLDRAVQATLAGQGCLPGGSAGVQGVLTS